MGGWAHGGGFSLDAAVRSAGADRAGRERLLRYCARPPFALEHLHQHDAAHLLYDLAKPRPDGRRNRDEGRAGGGPSHHEGRDSALGAGDPRFGDDYRLIEYLKPREPRPGRRSRD